MPDHRRRFLAACLGAPNPTLKTGVKVVNVIATVRDKKDQIIKTLTQEDFSIDENTLPQTIRYFTRETDLELTLGLLVDTSGSQRRVLAEERAASFFQVTRKQPLSANFERSRQAWGIPPSASPRATRL